LVLLLLLTLLLLLLPAMVLSAADGCRCSHGGSRAAGSGSDDTTPSSWCDAACSVSSTASRHAASRPFASSSSKMPLHIKTSKRRHQSLDKTMWLYSQAGGCQLRQRQMAAAGAHLQDAPAQLNKQTTSDLLKTNWLFK
jgi:hypothetical protein